jgi:hypothetical protein
MADSITPPPELLNQWSMDFYELGEWRAIAIQAARWGADQELEACCEYVYERLKLTTVACIAQELRADRRPKSPSLKKQALAELKQLRGDANSMGMGFDAPTIRRALEALPDD